MLAAATSGSKALVCRARYSFRTSRCGLASSAVSKLLSEKNVLVIGETDFSFTRIIAQMGICNSIIASSTVNQMLSAKWYPKAKDNSEFLSSCGYSVEFGVDDSKLSDHFASRKFDLIWWNFPHYPGRQNIKYNRGLLQRTFLSASNLIKDEGSIQVSLRHDQSGLRAMSKADWDQSWKLSENAGIAGLLLTKAVPFHLEDFPGYTPLIGRGKGKAFSCDSAELYTLQREKPGRQALQCPIYTHELHLLSPSLREDWPLFEGKVERELQAALGIDRRFLWSVLLVDLYSPPEGNQVVHVVQVAFGSLAHGLSRERADRLRERIEDNFKDKEEFK